ncbi:hypothetical protein Pcinc_020807 [Petrolisthes cinctipes]|uniref:Uncharacterized protein n=1 Tax=Petrolisthes cinctipes TaxID=88211 RepID=A0AAE1FIE5_PETCI|nr:hypothetical protein Pcinc_020807 [Petrolisthes cinctipes]
MECTRTIHRPSDLHVHLFEPVVDADTAPAGNLKSPGGRVGELPGPDGGVGVVVVIASGRFAPPTHRSPQSIAEPHRHHRVKDGIHGRVEWSRRDGHTINLPWSLLVRGDTVLLRPGQKVPGRCRPLQTDLLDDPFEDAELEALSLSDLAVTWSALWHHFLFTVLGCQPLPTTTANILHVLASVTNLCCVDKKGVLSWPNPKTEKVFFPQEQSTQPHNYQLESESVLMSLIHNHQTAFGL